MNPTIENLVANELSVNTRQVKATIDLIDQGATIPFIARYRKEATGSLDDIQLRKLQQRLTYLRDLQERRCSITKSISEQDKMTAELLAAIENAITKTELEDIYRPFKVKRRTKATIAREAGLDVLANKLLNEPENDPEQLAGQFVDCESEFNNLKTCIDGAKYILMEQISEDAGLLANLRQYLDKSAFIQSCLIESNDHRQAHKFRDYFDYHEQIVNIPSHRVLALLRGRNEGVLKINLVSDINLIRNPESSSQCLTIIADHYSISHLQRPADPWLMSVVNWTWKVKLLPHFENEFFKVLKEKAELQAIRIFADNLRDLLLAAPAGGRVVMGLDPALRTGVKVVIVDSTGKLLTHTVIFPHAPQKQWSQGIRKLKTLCEMYKVSLISIGNGTASRETERLVKEVQQQLSKRKPDYMVVSEAGASVYSASELASKEFADLDVSIRGAVSIARRIQDPLSELVKIEPKAIGVGQYQHDVNQRLLSDTLNNVVEYCVNAVGVELNMASAELLSKVAGLSRILSENIVDHRDKVGPFTNRQQLMNVERLGTRTFEQCAGFLRISDGENPLDVSAVHPEAYSVVESILNKTDNKLITDIIGDKAFLQELVIDEYTSEKFGTITVRDIISELEKPGRDPRPVFKTAKFNEEVETLQDVQKGMVLEGVISNVTNFGTFVDIGIHQDGLIHISALSESFVSDPRKIVKAGDIVKVWVIDIDDKRKQISLSMVQPDQINKPFKQVTKGTVLNQSGIKKQKQKPTANSAFAHALSNALAKK